MAKVRGQQPAERVRTRPSVRAEAVVDERHERLERLPLGADEIAFLKSRARSTPEKPATIRARLAQLVDDVRRSARASGVEAHAHGTALNTLYMRHADAVLGFASFRALLAAWWPDDVGNAYRAMRIARHCTEAQAELGATKCELGIRLMKRLGLDAFDRLLDEKRPLVLTLPEEGTVSFADATVSQLRSALGLMETPPPGGEDEQEALEAVRREIAALLEASPEYLDLAPTASLQDGEVEVRLRARGRLGRRKAAKFLAALG